MNRTGIRKIVLGMIVLGVLTPFFRGMAEDLPAELSFLEDIKTPKYYYIRGTAEPLDSNENTLMRLPFVFYWEKGSYTFDNRLPGGFPGVFILGVEDTFWLYDFIHGIKVTAMKDQDLGWMSQLPFTAENIMGMFGILSDAFADIDTFAVSDGLIEVTSRDGSVYAFEEESKLMKSLTRGSTIISFADFRPYNDGFLPYEMRFNKGVLFPGSAEIKINIDSYSFKRQRQTALREVDLPPNMARAFDIRNVEQ